MGARTLSVFCTVCIHLACSCWKPPRCTSKLRPNLSWPGLPPLRPGLQRELPLLAGHPSSRTEVRLGKKSATLRSWEANCPAVQKENLSPQPWEGQIIFCCREVPEFIHPPTEEHFECFQVLAIKVLLLKDPGVSFYMDISVQLIWINTKDHSFWIVWYYTRSSTLAWKIPWMEEPGGLQSMGSLRVGHNWATSLSLFTFTHWRRKWQPTPVFLPGESQGRGSLVGCRLWGRTESDTTEAT